MKKLLTTRLSLLLLICMLFSIIGTSCNLGGGEIQVTEKVEGLENVDTSDQVDDGGIKGTYKPPEGVILRN